MEGKGLDENFAVALSGCFDGFRLRSHLHCYTDTPLMRRSGPSYRVSPKSSLNAMRKLAPVKGNALRICASLASIPDCRGDDDHEVAGGSDWA
jgi:hypothetical protein